MTMDRMDLYNLIYALAARDGREVALFGTCAAAAREAFSRSLTGAAFPELWFEVPLAGDPWLDLHALVSQEDVAGEVTTFAGHEGVYDAALAWFAHQQPGAVRQLALSYDTSAGDVEHPAVQLLVGGRDMSVPLGFLEAAGRADARDSYRSFVGSMPAPWYACYVGAFPGRQASGRPSWVRVECIVGDEAQRSYAADASALRAHLAQVGLEDLRGDAVDGMQMLARSPFPLELQFNVGPDGRALPTVSASVRFQPSDWMGEEGRAAIAELARQVRAMCLADGRVEQLAQTLFAKRVTHEGASAVVSCFPAFVKLRWREGAPCDAKAYLLAHAHETTVRAGRQS